MTYRWEITASALRQGVVGIVRTRDAESAVAAARAALDGGLRSIELPLTNPGALAAISALTAAHPDATIGAGTVLDETSAVLAIRAGARFLVSPSVDTAVIRTAHRYGAAAFPGAGSVTEIVRALEEGADAVKVFPASALDRRGWRTCGPRCPRPRWYPRAASAPATCQAGSRRVRSPAGSARR
jgi:2-dehydro-3-deoxyphosphogluconate aldolase/(4S)-4-hydroxy-2-oxoglutarate aldolase